jgi:hypothetical protein
VDGMGGAMTGGARHEDDGGSRSSDIPQDALTQWLTDNGAPRFNPHYSARDNLPVLMSILFAVLAFELGMAPWLGLTALGLALAPAFIAIVALMVRVAWGRVGVRWWYLASLIAGGLFGWGISNVFSDWWSDFTVDTVVVLILLNAAYRFQVQGYSFTHASLRTRRRLLIALILSIVVLGLEGVVVPSASEILSTQASIEAPQGVVALCLALVILFMSQRLGAGAESASSSSLVGADRLLAAVPFLVLLLCATAVLFPYIASETWQIILPLFAILASLSVALLVTRHQNDAHHLESRSPGGLSDLAFVQWLLLYLSAYPITVWIVHSRTGIEGQGAIAPIYASGTPLSGAEAALFVLLCNMAYLLLAWLLAALAVERITKWAMAHTITHIKNICWALISHLPLVLVFAAFFLLTAETWEIAVETEHGRDWEFWVLVAGLFLTSWLLLIVDALRIISASSRFTGASLHKAINRAFEDDAEGRRRAVGLTAIPDEVKELAERVPDDNTEVRLHLSPYQWANAMVILVIYQVLILVPLVIVASVVFLGLAEISVPPGVAATWIGGDEPRGLDASDLSARSGFGDPWLRVALLLAAFAVLERIVRIVTEPDTRASIWGPVELALKLRFSVALVLQECAKEQASA